MGFNRKSLTSILLSILAVVSALALYTYGNSAINQILILSHFGILVVLGFLNDVFSDKFVLTVLLLNLASLGITMAYHSSFGVSLIFINLLLACLIFNNIKVEKNIFLLIHLIPAILWTVIVAFSVKGEYWQHNGDIYHYLFLGNTFQKNTMGILCLGCVFHYVTIVEKLKCRRATKNIVSFLIALLFLLKMMEAHSRSVIFALILFVILYYCVRQDISYRYFYVIMLVGIIFTGLFTIYYVNNVVELDLGDVMGASSFNRLGTWKAAFSLIRRFPIFGSGTDVKMLTYDSAHNTILSILKTIGIIPMISYVFCFAKRLQKFKTYRYFRTCQLAIISALMVTIFESFYVESYIYLTFLIMLINPTSSSENTNRGTNVDQDAVS